MPAKPLTPQDIVDRHFAGIAPDADLYWIASQPEYSKELSKYIRHWYDRGLFSKRRRFVVWMRRYRLGASEKKMRVLLGNTPEFQEWVDSVRRKKKSCVEYWIAKHGADGERMYREYQTRVNRESVDVRVRSWHEAFATKTPEELSAINKKKAVTLESCVERYGEEEGVARWEDILKRKDNISVDAFIRKGLNLEEAEAANLAEREKRKRTPFSRTYWDARFPESPIEAHEAHVEYCSRREHFSLVNCIKRYGEEEGRKIHTQRTQRWLDSYYDKTPEEMAEINRKKTFGQISMASGKFFDDLMKNFPDLEYQTGSRGGELCLHRGGRKWYLYDFFCARLNLIIEYDGTYWHSESGEADAAKEQFARDAGYDFIRVIDTDKGAMKRCYEHIQRRLGVA